MEGQNTHQRCCPRYSFQPKRDMYVEVCRWRVGRFPWGNIAHGETLREELIYFRKGDNNLREGEGAHFLFNSGAIQRPHNSLKGREKRRRDGTVKMPGFIQQKFNKERQTKQQHVTPTY